MVILHPSSRRKGEKWESGDGLCPSDPEKRRSVAMVTHPFHHSAERKEGQKEVCHGPAPPSTYALTELVALAGYDLCPSLPGTWWNVP